MKYRRGPYYRPKRHFPLLPRETIVISLAFVAGAAGLYGLAARDNDSQLTGQASVRSAGQDAGNEAREVTPQALAGGAAAAAAATAALKTDLSDPDKKEIAMRLVSTAENSSLDWRAQFGYIEDIGDGRGYTAGIIGFCSGTGDMLELVEQYTKTSPGNRLAPFLPALRQVNGTASHAGLGEPFVQAWKAAAADPAFQNAQESERDRVYFNPALEMAKADGLRTLGQFVYYDAAVMHGPDAWGGGLPDLRARALQKAKPPAQGGDETAYLQAFLDVRKAEMAKEAAHRDVSRIDGVQLAFLRAGNFELKTPLQWTVYGDEFSIPATP